MKEQLKKKAVLLFALEAEVEIRRHRHWNVQDRLLQRLYYSLNRRATRVGRQAAGDFFHFDSTHQRGDSYGERLANAISDIFKEGYEQIVVIGNDHIDLHTQDINQGFAQLEQNPEDLYVLPSKDGGIALIGIDKEQFNHSEFSTLPWQTDQLYSHICVQGGVSTDKTSLQDLDHLSSLSNILSTGWFHTLYQDLRKAVLAIVSSLNLESPSFRESSAPPTFQSTYSLRGPPLSAIGILR